jgi:hypothetical protein
MVVPNLAEVWGGGDKSFSFCLRPMKLDQRLDLFPHLKNHILGKKLLYLGLDCVKISSENIYQCLSGDSLKSLLKCSYNVILSPEFIRLSI